MIHGGNTSLASFSLHVQSVESVFCWMCEAAAGLINQLELTGKCIFRISNTPRTKALLWSCSCVSREGRRECAPAETEPSTQVILLLQNRTARKWEIVLLKFKCFLRSLRVAVVNEAIVVKGLEGRQKINYKKQFLKKQKSISSMRQ